MSTWAIVGIVIGSIVFILLILGIFLSIRMNKKKNRVLEEVNLSVEGRPQCEQFVQR